jgi:7-keto-8-aminopelargonate synthetase-like enzyme
MSLIEGARMSQASIAFFRHNQLESLEKNLKKAARSKSRILVCTEGIFSADGNYGKLKEIVQLAKKYGAYTLVDEAHSTLIAGESGRGVCEVQDVLSDVDFYIEPVPTEEFHFKTSGLAVK